MNDSSTGGTLLPTNDFPVNDEALDELFQTLISQITGLNGQFVRPRFQGEPPNPPEFGATWAAVGVTETDDDTFPQQQLNADGTYTLVQHELLGVLCSFYGPKAQQAARMARDNIQIAQNRETIETAGIYFKYADRPIKAPLLMQTRWVNRIDVTFTFTRAITETYAILPIEKIDIDLETDSGLSREIDITLN